MLSKKRRRLEPPSIHPRNRYAEEPPDFGALAALYPSFGQFVFPIRSGGRLTIDWTDFNATRELTRVLLLHDHGVNWWIPDGQLCPTVPNRSNYIHWIEDLLSSTIVPPIHGSDEKVKGFDIGTGANCIYPLLGASILGWSFVGSDITDVALEWAKYNVESNPHLSELIEIRNANDHSHSVNLDQGGQEGITEERVEPKHLVNEGAHSSTNLGEGFSHVSSILVGVVRDGEKFDFCMCNPPFFESIEEAGRNPRTACGGTMQEMVYPGGEQAFITRIVEDSVALRHSFRWFTSMVGRKASLKILVSNLRKVGVSVLKTTEFVQGQTVRWGLAWSFMVPSNNIIEVHAQNKNHFSFTLQGLRHQIGAFHVLKSAESFFLVRGASCKVDSASFCIDVSISGELNLEKGLNNVHGCAGVVTTSGSSEHPPNSFQQALKGPTARVSVFEQIPGTLVVKGSILDRESSISGNFSSLFMQLECALQLEFLKKPAMQSRN